VGFARFVPSLVEVERIQEREADAVDAVLARLRTAHAPREDKQLALFIRYHEETRNYARLISTVSLLFAGIGFCVIVIAFATAQPATALTDQGRALLMAFAGVVIEAVSSLFFVQSNRARKAVAEFLDRLREDRKLDRALDLAATVPHEALRSRLQTMIALSFINRPVSDELLISLFGIGSDQDRDERREE
jgi:hypothetical protein